MLQRKRVRLDAAVYRIPGQYFSITIGTHQRQHFFADPAIAAGVFRLTSQGILSVHAHLSAACLMPDHAHLLIAPKKESLVSVLQQWKSYTTCTVRKEHGIPKLWQRSFYDHALRKEEDVHVVARYILGNPVRDGLTADWRHYPYSWCEWDL